MAKGDKSGIKCKKCGTTMIATTDPFMATVFGKGGHQNDTQKLSQWVQCPKDKSRNIERLE